MINKKNGYIQYHSENIPDYSFEEINIEEFDGNLYEKKIIITKPIEVFYNKEKFILISGTHYFPILSEKYVFITYEREKIQIFKIHKPKELIVSKIYKDKQVIIDKFLKDDKHTKSISHIISFYTLFITNIHHYKYNYIFSVYNDELTFSKYLQLNPSIKDSINYQVYNSLNYIEKRVNTIEYKGKITNILNDETVVENVLTSLNNQKIIDDPYVNIHLLSFHFENETSNFLKIKYLYKDHIIIRKKLKDEYMLILRPPKYDEYTDLYEPYPHEVIENMWKKHFDIVNILQDDKSITFYEI
jgi:hypothetical protein